MQNQKEKLEALVYRAIKEKKAIAICGSGTVNGKEFPMLEYDNITEIKAIAEGFRLQVLFDLNVFAVFKTRCGYHLRYFFDNALSHEKIIEIINASNTSKEFSKIAKKYYCTGRVAGKYKLQDIKFIGFYGAIKRKNSTEWVIGKSLFALHMALMKLQLKKDLLLW